eukprot:6175574-Pleurochrysis_carterae.AAC.6
MARHCHALQQREPAGQCRYAVRPASPLSLLAVLLITHNLQVAFAATKGICSSSTLWHANSCLCSQYQCFMRKELECRPSFFCENTANQTWPPETTYLPRAAIATALVQSGNTSHMFSRRRFHQSYLSLCNLLGSLARVNSRLPLFTMTMGDEMSEYEERLRELGSLTVRVKQYLLPRWAAAYHSASFVKLGILNFTM